MEPEETGPKNYVTQAKGYVMASLEVSEQAESSKKASLANTGQAESSKTASLAKARQVHKWPI